MKKLAVVLIYISSAVLGQQSRIGFADVDFILSKMPEMKQVESNLQSTNTQLQMQMQAKMSEYQQKLADYQQNAVTMIDAVRQDKEAELTRMQGEIQRFEQNAQASLQKKQQELLKPVYEKVGTALKTVAKNNNFEIILNGQVGGMDVVLYGDERLDTSDLVLKQMGITISE